MQIFVRSPSGRMISLRVYPDETLYEVKKKIMDKYNFVFDGVRMDNDYRKLADYNIKHQSKLDLQEKMQIHFKEALHGMTFTMDVESSYTIDNIKDRIERVDGFPKARQCLLFAGEQLEGKHTLADYKICKDSDLLLVLYPSLGGAMQICLITLVGKTVTFKVDGSDSVNSLKVKIYEMDGIRPVHQRLLYGGRQMDGNRTLASYNVKNGSTIYLVLRLCGC